MKTVPYFALFFDFRIRKGEEKCLFASLFFCPIIPLRERIGNYDAVVTAADAWDSEEVLDNLYALPDSKVLLFVREFKADRVTGGAEAYTYLGTENYVKHDGSRPMNITWRLDRPITAKFLKKTNKLVVG